MTEREYIDATNLAKLRAVRSILRDIQPMNSTELSCYQEAMAATHIFEDRLTRVVCIDPETDDAAGEQK